VPTFNIVVPTLAPYVTVQNTSCTTDRC